MSQTSGLGNWQAVLDASLASTKDNGVLAQFKNMQTDADRIKFIHDNKLLSNIDWVKDYFTDMCPALHRKNKERAQQFKQDGNRMFTAGRDNEALIAYTQSMQFAPCGTEKGEEDLAVAYGNRSAVLFRLGKYKECLTDIQRAVEEGFPTASKHKLLVRSCLCHARLGQETDAVKAEREINDLLETCGEQKTTDFLQKELAKITAEIKSMKGQNAAEPKPVSVPSVSYGTNSIVVQASSAVEMKTSPSQGRFLQAKQGVKRGDTLIVERPFAAVLLPPHYRTHCLHCFGCLPDNPVGCKHCSSVLYCDEECRDLSWKTYHQVECHYTDLLHSVGIAHLSLRIVLTAGLPYLTEFLKTREQMEENFPDRVPGVTTDGRYERNYLTVYDLMTHTPDMVVDDLFQYSMTASLLLAILIHSGWFASADEGYLADTGLRNALVTFYLEGNLTKILREKSPDIDAMQSSPLSSEQNSVHLDSTQNSSSSSEQMQKSPLSEQNSVHLDSTQNLSSSSEQTSECFETTQKSSSTQDAECTLATQNSSSPAKNLPLFNAAQAFMVGGGLLRHVQQLVCNAHAITALHTKQVDVSSAVETQSQVRIATAIYPTASLMNHSCDPTIISSFQKDVLIVKSVKDVPTGGEIFNCYGPHCKRMNRQERQRQLKSQYFFNCVCEACCTEQNGQDMIQGLKCPNCGETLPLNLDVPSCIACHVTVDMATFLSQLETADAAFNEGVKFLEDGDHKRAVRKFEACLTVRSKLMTSGNHDLGQVHDAVAQCLAAMGRYKEAADHLAKSLAVTEAIFGANSVETARELHKMAEVQIHAGQPKDALHSASRSLDLACKLFSESDSWVQELLCLKTALTNIIADGGVR